MTVPYLARAADVDPTARAFGRVIDAAACRVTAEF